MQFHFPRSGDVIHPQLWKSGSGYETKLAALLWLRPRHPCDPAPHVNTFSFGPRGCFAYCYMCETFTPIPCMLPSPMTLHNIWVRHLLCTPLTSLHPLLHNTSLNNHTTVSMAHSDSNNWVCHLLHTPLSSTH